MQVAMILLAAGASRRFGAGNKLLADLGGEPLVRRVARALRAGNANGNLIAVVDALAPDREAVAAAVQGLADTVAVNPDASFGMSRSIRAGLAAIPQDAGGVLVAQGDMPALTGDLVARLVDAFTVSGGRAIVFPETENGRRGTPVIWPRDFVAGLSRLSGDTGGRDLIRKHAERCRPVPVSDAEALEDIDTREALAAWKLRHGLA